MKIIIKKPKILTLALCLTCLPMHIYGAETIAPLVEDADTAHAPFQVFKNVDTRLAALYPRTLTGFDKVNTAAMANTISVVRRVEADWKLASLEDISALRTSYFGELFKFMGGLRDRTNGTVKDTEEFRALWASITSEAEAAVTGGIGELNWRMVQVMYIRGLLLASGGGSDEAHDLLSSIPEMEVFFGALAPTPVHLRMPGQPIVPAWKHSSVACLINSGDDETRGANIEKPYLQTHPLHHDMAKLIKKEAKRLGLQKNVYLPMVDSGKIGITTLVKMWLNHVFPVPLTYDEYIAHGIALGSAVGGEHDKAHGKVDNRREEAHKAILNLLNKAAIAGKNVRTDALQLATDHIVNRYNALNQTLLAYVEAKEQTAIDALIAAMALAPDDANNTDRKAAEKLARQQYNTGVAALFQALHEAYAMKANVLEAPTLAEAITRLSANATSGESSAKFNELESFFNPASNLNDAQIFARIGERTLTSVGIYPEYQQDVPTPTTIAEYAAQGKVFMDTLTVKRGAVYTEVAFDVLSGKKVKVQVATTHYLVNTTKDENAVLGLVGQKVPEVALDMNTLRALPVGDASRTAALAQVQAWLAEVGTRTNAMVSGLTADVLAHTPVGTITAYDQLVASQNAAWTAFMPPVVVAPVVDMALVPVIGGEGDEAGAVAPAESVVAEE